MRKLFWASKGWANKEDGNGTLSSTNSEDLLDSRTKYNLPTFNKLYINDIFSYSTTNYIPEIQPILS